MSNRKLVTSADGKAEYWRYKRFKSREATYSGRAARRAVGQVFGRPLKKREANDPAASVPDSETSTPAD